MHAHFLHHAGFPLTFIGSWSWDFVYDWTILKFQRTAANGIDRPLPLDPNALRPTIPEALETEQARRRRWGRGLMYLPQCGLNACMNMSVLGTGLC